MARAARARPPRRHRHRAAGGDPRGPRLPPADRHGRAARGGRGRGGGAALQRARRGAGDPVPDAGARLHAAPPRLPGLGDAALERLRGVAARPVPLAGPPRLRPHPDRQRPRLEHPAGQHGGTADQRRVPRRRLRVVLLPHVTALAGADRGDPALGARRHGPRVRARDVAVPGDPARPRADGARREGDPGELHRARVDGLDGRPALVHAALERPDRVGRHGRRERGDRGDGPGPAAAGAGGGRGVHRGRRRAPAPAGAGPALAAFPRV